MLWQSYDAGGVSVGRSYQARIVEAAMMLVGAPSSQADVSVRGMDILKQCEDRAYDITRIAQNGDEWDQAVGEFHAVYEQRRRVEERAHRS